MQRDHETVEVPCCVAEGAGVQTLRDPVGDDPRELLRRRVHVCQARLLVEVAVVELRQHGAQHLGRPADVDDQSVVVELGPPERRVDDVGRAMEPLRRPEGLAPQAVGDQHVVPDGHAEHA